MDAAMTRFHRVVRGGRRWGAFALFFAVLLAPALAFAVGSVQAEKTTLDEADGRWKLNLTINYGGTPHVGHIPMVFQFTHTMHVERALTDESPNKPVELRVPLTGQQPINEDMDVGFSDPSGKLFDRTKFSFVIRRDRGFEAGEYTLKITRSSDGATMGQPIKLVLKGENPVVDRRAIVFVASDKKKKKEDPAAEGAPPSGDEPPPEEGGEEGLDDVGSEPEGPPPEPPKQGGCGCRTVGAANGASRGGVWSLGLLLLGLAFSRRRAKAR